MELVNVFHLIIGALIIILPFIILSRLNVKKRFSQVKQLSIITALLAWLELFVAGNLYTVYYPATKALIKAGSWPWAHSIFMEVKEHMGIMLPIVATISMGLVLKGKTKQSERWWLLTAGLSIIFAIMGFVIVSGASA